MNLSGNDKNKITGKKYQPLMSITGLNDQGQKAGYQGWWLWLATSVTKELTMVTDLGYWGQ